MPQSSYLLAVNCAGLAAERAAASLHLESGRGISNLRGIARVAPLAGTFAVAEALIEALRYYDPIQVSLCCCAGGLSEAFVPMGISLVVTVIAWIGVRCLTSQVETLDLQMRTATLELLNCLPRPRIL